MDQDASTTLEEFGRDVARNLAGAAFKDVKVATGAQLDRPVHFFTFLVEPDELQMRPGLLRIRLMQALRDGLLLRNDEHYPVIQMLDRTDWDEMEGA